jgi:hypothetical protein
MDTITGTLVTFQGSDGHAIFISRSRVSSLHYHCIYLGLCCHCYEGKLTYATVNLTRDNGIKRYFYAFLFFRPYKKVLEYYHKIRWPLLYTFLLTYQMWLSIYFIPCYMNYATDTALYKSHMRLLFPLHSKTEWNNNFLMSFGYITMSKW